MPNGVMSNWTAAQYEAETERVRSTQMKDIVSDMNPKNRGQGPRDYYWKHVYPGVDKGKPELRQRPGVEQPKIDDLILGILFHDLVLEGRQDFFAKEYNYGCRAWKDEVEDNDGKWAVTQSQYDTLKSMEVSFWANDQAAALLKGGGMSEQTFLWTDEKTGVDAKCRLDWLTHSAARVDLKTTRHKTWGMFESQLQELNYPMSFAFYDQGVDAVPDFNGMQTEFLVIMCSKVHPFYCYVKEIGSEYMRAGHSYVDTAFDRISRCREDYERIKSEGGSVLEAWPDFENNNPVATAPDWYLAQCGFAPETW